MVCSMNRSKVKVTSPSKLEIQPFSKRISFASYNGSWQLTTDFFNYGTMSIFDKAGFFIFGIVFVSRDFEVGTNISCEELTVSHVQG